MAKYNSKGYWDAQLRAAEKWKEKKAKIDVWQRGEKYYNHDMQDNRVPNFNLVYMIGSSMMPNLVYQFPHAVNAARRPEFNVWGRIFDGIDNWLLHEMDVQNRLEEAVINSFIKNTTCIQVGYDFDDRDLRRDEILFDTVPGALDTSRKYNQPWIDSIPAERLLVAEGTRNSRNCRWFAKGHFAPVRLIKELPGVIKVNVKATHAPSSVKKYHGNDWPEDKIEESGYIWYWEVHSQEEKQTFWMSSNGDFILPPEEDLLQVDGLPIEFLIFNRTRLTDIWGSPDVAYIESQHLELNEIAIDYRKIRRSAIPRFLYDSNILGEEEVANFSLAKPMMGIPVKLPPDKKINDVIAIINPTEPFGLIEVKKDLMNGAQLLVGIGPNQAGTFAQGRRTKFETQVVEERNLLRTGNRRQQIADIISAHLGRINTLVTKYWKGKVYVKVIGIEGAVHVVAASPAEFKEVSANLVTSINVESLAPSSRERRREEMLKMIEILAKMEGMEPQVFTLVNQLLSSFDWAQVQGALPQAPGTEVPTADRFVNQQQQAGQSPDLLNNLQGNLGGLNNLVGRLPEAQQTGGQNG